MLKHIGPKTLFADNSTSIKYIGDGVEKTCSNLEIESTIIMHSTLNHNQIMISGRRVRTANIESVLSTGLRLEYVPGPTVEHLLLDRNMRCRSVGAYILYSLIDSLASIHIGWLDFAPRNIIVSAKSNEIVLVDFERGIEYIDTPCFYAWMRGHPLEEISVVGCQFNNKKLYDTCNHKKCKDNVVKNLNKSTRRQYYCCLKDKFDYETLVEADNNIIEATKAIKYCNMILYPVKILDEIQRYCGLKIYWTCINTILSLSRTKRIKYYFSLSRRLKMTISDWVAIV